MNSSEWDKFRKQQAIEREQLRRLVSGMNGRVAKECEFKGIILTAKHHAANRAA